jgi:hypothetical protein
VRSSCARATICVAPPAARALVTIVVFFVILAALPGCRVDKANFQERVFRCDKGATDPQCGTDLAGRAMGCFAASQVGGTDFCAMTCDYDPAAPAGDGVACLKTNAEVSDARTHHIQLETCKPSDDLVVPGSACGGKGLGCYRTDLVEDEGVCTTMSPCATDHDCPDTVRSVCATTFLAKTVYPDAANIKKDHMFCLQENCQANGTSCSPGETCLRNVIPPEANPPDVCVPNCDSSLDCPPNFLCYRAVSTVVTPKVCIPGLLGFTCLDDMDCMVGTCEPNGISYKVCTTKCDAEKDCQQFDGIQGKFTCVKNNGAPSDPGVCQTPDSYRGSVCEKDDDCKARNAKEICNRFDPKAARGTCLQPCGDGGSCGQRGGINHTCLPSGMPQPVCFPGYFGLPCADDSNCVGDLTCSQAIGAQYKVCTLPCQVDADCTKGRWVGPASWCSPLGTCQAPLANDSEVSCAKDLQCQSGKCVDTKCLSAALGAN